MKLNIFIESLVAPGESKKNEYRFVEQYVKHLDSDAEVKICGAHGKNNLASLKSIMDQNTCVGEKNLVIFDCDNPDSGEESTREMVERVRKETGMEFDYFLFPNNQDSGTFENLLLHIINRKHECLLKCFEDYEKCIAGNNADEELYEIPNVKAKIYSYISSFKQSRSKTKKFKDGDCFFDNEEYWNLDDPYLDPLKSFLQKYL